MSLENENLEEETINKLNKIEFNFENNITDNNKEEFIKLFKKIPLINPQSLIFNFECCSGCSSHSFRS